MKTFLKIAALTVGLVLVFQTASPAGTSRADAANLLDCTNPSNDPFCVPCDPNDPEGAQCDPICLELPDSLDCLNATTMFVTTTLPPTTLPPTTLPVSTTLPDITLPPTTLPPTTLPPITLPPTTTTLVPLPDICVETPDDPVCFKEVEVVDLLTDFPDLADGEGDLPPGTLRADAILTDNGIGAKVPPSGNGVFAEGHAGDGQGQQLQIDVLNSGTIHLKEVGDEAANNVPLRSSKGTSTRRSATDSSSSASGEPCSGCAPPCQDESKTLSGFKESNTFKWRIRKRSIPGSLSKKVAMSAIKSGMKGIIAASNTCSIGDDVSITSTFLGRTTNKANLDASGNCLSPNGKNVVDFSTLPVAGRTCSWYAIKSGMDELVEADVRFNKNQRWTLNPKSCSRALDLAGTATHEWGHAFGLAHVGSTHKNLTMTELLPLCSAAPRTLGKGDVLGLKALY